MLIKEKTVKYKSSTSTYIGIINIDTVEKSTLKKHV